jgi:hypothetical protein
MDSLSALDPLSWDPEFLQEHPAYAAGNALGWLYRGNKQASTNQPLSGRLYLSKNGWLMLSVPNALVRGVFDALTAPGAELPTAGAMNLDDVQADLLNAHITVLTGDEVASIGANKINERGHMFGYALGGLKEITPKGDTLSKIWALQVTAPALSALRKSYGFSPLPKDEPFHITVAVRRKNVLRHNSVSKGNADTDGMPVQNSSRGELKAASAAENKHSNTLSRSGQKDLLPGGKADNIPDRDISPKALNEGQEDEREHTDNDQIAKEIAKDHLSQDPRYYEKEKLVEKMSESVYAQQLAQSLISRPLKYDYNKPVFQNVQNHLQEVKQRGDFMLQAQQNQQRYRAAIDPRYRYQLAMQAFHGNMPGPSWQDQMISQYGDGVMGQISNWAGGPR